MENTLIFCFGSVEVTRAGLECNDRGVTLHWGGQELCSWDHLCALWDAVLSFGDPLGPQLGVIWDLSLPKPVPCPAQDSGVTSVRCSQPARTALSPGWVPAASPRGAAAPTSNKWAPLLLLACLVCTETAINRRAGGGGERMAESARESLLIKLINLSAVEASQ